MREILFRGKEKGQWVYGYYWKFEQNGTEAHVIKDGADNLLKFNHICEPESIGQYTGLTDKNGKKIFEGDILKSFFRRRPIISVVKYGAFRPDFFYACAEDKGYDINKKIYGLFAKDNNGEEMMFAEDMHLTEIIGNVHDNPELLGGDAGD